MKYIKQWESFSWSYRGLVMSLLVSVSCDHEDFFPLSSNDGSLVSEILEVSPSGVSLSPGESLQFVANLGATETSPLSSIDWYAVGGLITQDGVFVAGDDSTHYQVRAELLTPDGVVVGLSRGMISNPSPPEIPQTSNATLFQDDFETGDFRRWGIKGVPLNNPLALGLFEGGAHIGEGWITSEMAHTGQYAWRAQVDPATPQTRSSWPVGKSSLERWRIVDGVRDFTVSAWYFFPSDFPTGIWSNVMQIKERQSPYTPTAAIVIDRNHKILLYEGNTKSVVKVSSTVIPRGRWVELKTRFVIDHTGGRVTTWLDGKLVLDEGGLNTLGGTTNTNVYFGVGNYLPESTGLARCHIYIDDVSVSDN